MIIASVDLVGPAKKSRWARLSVVLFFVLFSFVGQNDESRVWALAAVGYWRLYNTGGVANRRWMAII